MTYKVIVLAGGRGSRLQPDTWVPKPGLGLGNGKYLLQYQVDWLLSKNVKRGSIVVSTNQQVFDYLMEQLNGEDLSVTWVIENEQLGTGGAIRGAIQMFPNTDLFYVMNVDDLLFSESFYAPSRLLKMPKDGMAQILTGFGRFPYGVVHTKIIGGRNFVVGFEQKPLIEDRPVSIGHVVFRRSVGDVKLLDYLPVIGDYENTCLPELAKMGLVHSLLFKGTWRTVNNAKELAAVKKYFREKNGYFEEKNILQKKVPTLANY